MRAAGLDISRHINKGLNHQYIKEGNYCMLKSQNNKLETRLDQPQVLCLVFNDQ